MNNEKVYGMRFGKVYPLLVSKAEKKGRTLDEVTQVITWLTGYTTEEIEKAAAGSVTYGDFSKGQIYHHKRILDRTHHALRMVNHLVKCYWESRLVPGHDIGCRITYKNNVYSCRIHNLGRRIIICGEHCYLLAAFFHFKQFMSRQYTACSFC